MTPDEIHDGLQAAAEARAKADPGENPSAPEGDPITDFVVDVDSLREQVEEFRQRMSVRQEKIRVMRLIVYEGPRKWVEGTVERSIHGTHMIDRDKKIIGITIGDVAEIIEPAKAIVKGFDEE